MSRFSEKIPSYDHKININTSYTNIITQQSNFDVQPQNPVNTQNVTGQPLLKNMIPPPGVAYPTPTSAPVIVAPPVLLNVPPPQVLQPQMTNNAIVAPATANILMNVQNVATVPTQNVPPPCLPTMELSSIPPPTPIQIHNIPQPEPINTLTIPPPAPIQVQNIPPPSPIQLNEIPNPKPLDILNIPTPSDSICPEKTMSDPDFLKNIPPPNKSVPPPNLPENPVTLNVGVPPPPPTCLPPPNVLPPPPPPPLPQNVLVSVPPPQFSSIQTTQQQNTMPVTVPLLVHPPVSVSNTIQPLMAQPVLPPPGMGLQHVNVNCPPPVLTSIANAAAPPPVFVTMTNRMPPMNVPPPTTTGSLVMVDGTCRDLNAGKDLMKGCCRM